MPERVREAPGNNPLDRVLHVGETGVVGADLSLVVDGEKLRVPRGTVALVKEAQEGGFLCQLYSGFDGREALLPVSSLREQPSLSARSESGRLDEPRDYLYREYASLLWAGAPRAEDVAQGHLNDCFLLAAMGAVAAADPQAIRRLIAPHTDGERSYRVTLHVRDGKGRLAERTVEVDTTLPSMKSPIAMPAYALCDRPLRDHGVPIWPALIEKAYALLQGGYREVDEGGLVSTAMEALTGRKSRFEAELPDEDEELLAGFVAFQEERHPVVCATLGSVHALQRGRFEGAGEGPYRATLLTDQGDPAEIVRGSLRLRGQQGRPAKDDKQGALKGPAVAEGTVDYDAGEVEVRFRKDQGPQRADELAAEFHWRGTLDKTLGVFAHHSYIFERVEKGRLIFKNPWGEQHPEPIPPAALRRLFNGFVVNPMGRSGEANP